MGEPKPFASLTSGLLARKGDAKPAMRRQNIGNPGGLAMGHEDLGWNDMGEDGGLSASGPFSGLSPMGGVVSPVAQPAPQVTPVAGIGRAACGERVCQYVYISGVAGSFK